MAFDLFKTYYIQKLDEEVPKKSIKIKKSKMEFSKLPKVSFLVFACIYLIKYRSDLNENLFPQKVIAIPITLNSSKHYNKTLVL